LHIPQNVEPRRGEINATLSGLGCRFLTDCYILATPSGLITLQKTFAGEFSFEKSRRDENIIENMIDQ
jgi:glutamate synthase domain-containing protein 2